MNDTSDFDTLDSLLAQPALISDQGFSQRLHRKIRKVSNYHARVFLAAAASWLILALCVASPVELVEEFLQFSSTFPVAELFSFLTFTISNLDVASIQSNYSAIIIALLSIAAILSLLVRDY